MARIITSEDDVPKGWKRIVEITNSPTDAKILSDAHNAGTLDAVKLMRTTSDMRTGAVWMDPALANALLARCQARRDAVSKPRQQIEPTAVTPPATDTEVGQQLVGYAFALVSGLLDRAERIAVALENIATTPKSTEDQGDATL
jgi:hypothetical protein